MASLPSVARDLTTFDQLGTADRIRLQQDLWDEIAATPDAVPLTDAQRAELDRRLEEHRADPDACVDWADVKARLRSR